jgi:acyl-CoA thioesterase-1
MENRPAALRVEGVSMRRRRVALLLCLIGAPACGSPDHAREVVPVASPAATAPGVTGARARPRIVVLGDSLTAGLGLRPSQAYPALLQRMIDEGGYGMEVVNAGVSGDTSAGGLRRLDWALEGDPRILVLALGANDGLRGVPAEDMGKNLEAIVERSRERGIAVLLAGMEAPPNYGPLYTAEFRRVFRDLAGRHDVTFVPFLLDGVAGVASLNQADGIHPTADGARRIAEHLWKALEPMVEQTVSHD